MCVRDVDVTKRGSHNSERSCICVLRMSMLLGGEAMIVNDRVMCVRDVDVTRGEAMIVNDRVMCAKDVDVPRRGSHDSERSSICV